MKRTFIITTVAGLALAFVASAASAQHVPASKTAPAAAAQPAQGQSGDQSGSSDVKGNVKAYDFKTNKKV